MREILRFQPLYQERVWGGNALAAVFDRTLPSANPIGESWEVVDRAEAQSVVKEGAHAGASLRDLLRKHTAAIMGPEWPAEPIRLYGAGTNSGTFDYFTEAVVGRVGAIRDDFSASEDDNVLVQGVEGDRNALGFFGYAYYAENTERLKAIAVDGGDGCIAPEPQSIRDAYLENLGHYLEFCKKQCQSSGVDYCLLNTSQPLSVTSATSSTRAPQRPGR